MRREWLNMGIELACTPPDQSSGGKKYFRRRSLTFRELELDISLEDVGYTPTKMSLLRGLYLHEPSLELATRLWEVRCRKKKPGSVSFHCYNHLLKAHNDDLEKTSNKIGSLMGPCLQSVVLTLVDGQYCDVDVYYRTTELFKKFPADLVLIHDHMLSRFDFTKVPVRSINMVFANITISQTYFAMIIPLVDDPVELFLKVKQGDPEYYRYIVRDTRKYLEPDVIDEHSFPFNQARRSAKGFRELISEGDRKSLLSFLIKESPR